MMRTYGFVFVFRCLLLLGADRAGAQATVAAAANAASFQEVYAPGMQLTIFGNEFTTEPLCQATELPLPTTLCGVRVLLGGEPIELSIVNSTQISGILPATAAVGPAQLTVEVGGALLDPLEIGIDPHAPGLSTATVEDTLVGFFTNASTDGQLVTPSTAAASSQIVQGSGTGFGLSDLPASVAQLIATAPRNQEAPAISLTVGGEAADVLSAGPNPAFPGTDGINFTVPSGIAAGLHPVILEINGFASNSVLLPVSGESQLPQVSAAVNGASFAPNAPVAAGSILSLFTVNLTGERQLGLFPATEVDGLSVTFDGTAAPLVDIVPDVGQINIIAPNELPVTGTVNVQLTTAGGTSATFELVLSEAAPGIFRIGGTSFAAALRANTRWLPIPDALSADLNLPIDCEADEINVLSDCGQPIRPGEALSLFATGLGRATAGGDPAGDVLPTGTLAPGDPLYETVMMPDVSVGGIAAEVLFSGLAPGFSGLNQVNIVIPAGVEPGDEVPVELVMPNGAMDSVVIAVQAP